MISSLLGKKIGMTQVYDAQNVLVPVTVVEAGPCAVVQVKTEASDGYNAVQIGFQVARPPMRSISSQAFATTVVGSKSTLKYLALPVDDPKQRRPDITRAWQRLGWKPVVDLETGLAKTIEYFKSRV